MLIHPKRRKLGIDGKRVVPLPLDIQAVVGSSLEAAIENMAENGSCPGHASVSSEYVTVEMQVGRL